MKKFRNIFLSVVIALVLFTGAILSGCGSSENNEANEVNNQGQIEVEADNQQQAVYSASVENLPTTYEVGDNFSIIGKTLVLQEQGSANRVTVAITGDMISQLPDMTSVGVKQVKISYAGATYTINITVVENEQKKLFEAITKIVQSMNDAQVKKISGNIETSYQSKFLNEETSFNSGKIDFALSKDDLSKLGLTASQINLVKTLYTETINALMQASVVAISSGDFNLQNKIANLAPETVLFYVVNNIASIDNLSALVFDSLTSDTPSDIANAIVDRINFSYVIKNENAQKALQQEFTKLIAGIRNVSKNGSIDLIGFTGNVLNILSDVKNCAHFQPFVILNETFKKVKENNIERAFSSVIAKILSENFEIRSYETNYNVGELIRLKNIYNNNIISICENFENLVFGIEPIFVAMENLASSLDSLIENHEELKEKDVYYIIDDFYEYNDFYNFTSFQILSTELKTIVKVKNFVLSDAYKDIALNINKEILISLLSLSYSEVELGDANEEINFNGVYALSLIIEDIRLATSYEDIVIILDEWLDTNKFSNNYNTYGTAYFIKELIEDLINEENFLSEVSEETKNEFKNYIITICQDLDELVLLEEDELISSLNEILDYAVENGLDLMDKLPGEIPIYAKAVFTVIKAFTGDFDSNMDRFLFLYNDDFVNPYLNMIPMVAYMAFGDYIPCDLFEIWSNCLSDIADNESLENFTLFEDIFAGFYEYNENEEGLVKDVRQYFIDLDTMIQNEDFSQLEDKTFAIIEILSNYINENSGMGMVSFSILGYALNAISEYGFDIEGFANDVLNSDYGLYLKNILRSDVPFDTIRTVFVEELFKALENENGDIVIGNFNENTLEKVLNNVVYWYIENYKDDVVDMLARYVYIYGGVTEIDGYSEARKMISSIYDDVVSGDFNLTMILSNITTYVDRYFSTDSKTAFYAMSACIAILSGEEVDFNEILADVDLPDGIEIDFNKLIGKLASDKTWLDVIELKSFTTELIMEDDCFVGENISFEIEINFDIDAVKFIENLKVNLKLEK